MGKSRNITPVCTVVFYTNREKKEKKKERDAIVVIDRALCEYAVCTTRITATKEGIIRNGVTFFHGSSGIPPASSWRKPTTFSLSLYLYLSFPNISSREKWRTIFKIVCTTLFPYWFFYFI
jgi:hypothetical protein